MQKDNQQLLRIYKEEKAIVLGRNPIMGEALPDPDAAPTFEDIATGGVRTGLEDQYFPTFQEWKKTYLEETGDTVIVPVDQADKMLDDEVSEELNRLETLEAEASTTYTEDDDMTEENTTTTDAETTTPAETTKPTSKRKAATKKTTAKKGTKSTAKKAAAKKGPSKASKAQKIFDKFYGTKERKWILERFVSQAGLTDAGAATYYQKMKRAVA